MKEACYRKIPFITFVVKPCPKIKINLAGCNFNCKGCFAIAKEEVGRQLSVEELINLIIKSCLALYDNGKIPPEAQVTGGEPAINRDYLISLIRGLRNLGIERVGISTNGYFLDRSLVEELKSWGIDYIKLDIKAYTERIHVDYTGRSNAPILKAVRLLYEYNLNFYVRTIFIPQIIDLREIKKIAAFLSQIDKGISYKIYQFAPEQLNEIRADELQDRFKRIDEISKLVIKDWDMQYLTMNQILSF